MSQNGPYSGPPWSSGGGPEEPYGEPSDPWGEQSAVPTEPPVWGSPSPSIPQQPVAYHSGLTGSGNVPPWGPPVAPPAPRRNTPMVILVVTLGLLICVGLGATLFLLNQRNNQEDPQANDLPATTGAAQPGAAPVGSEDARFNVKEGDCVVNEGSDEEPEMRTTACTSGTFVVLKRIKGKTSGEKDAEGKCSKVDGYTKWYFYDSPLDDLDFVLCLKEHKSL